MKKLIILLGFILLNITSYSTAMYCIKLSEFEQNGEDYIFKAGLCRIGFSTFTDIYVYHKGAYPDIGIVSEINQKEKLVYLVSDDSEIRYNDEGYLHVTANMKSLITPGGRVPFPSAWITPIKNIPKDNNKSWFGGNFLEVYGYVRLVKKDLMTIYGETFGLKTISADEYVKKTSGF